MQCAWLTDIHLNFLESEARQEFYQEIINTQCDGVLISGDIAEAINVEAILIEMHLCFLCAARQIKFPARIIL